VRPQCFTTIIGLLKAAALTAHPYRKQLERARREELDVSTFEEKVATIVGSIENDYERAAKNYERAEEDIDNIIKKLQAGEKVDQKTFMAEPWYVAEDKLTEITYTNNSGKEVTEPLVHVDQAVVDAAY
jgi:hypothetical protein